MPYGVGIDLGTSFTSAAVHGPDGTWMVPLSADVVVPSVVYARPDGTLLTGTDAEHAARAEGESGRVARGFKRRLGDPTPLVLGGAAYSPAALMAAQLRDVLAEVTRAMGGPPATVVLTCPAIWGPYRREHFAEVPRLAGVPASLLITEPEAAATHYSVERRLGDGEVVAVYDLGGGTFDTTILRMRSGGMEILGTPEGIEQLGGMDFDETLLAHVDDRLDGAVSALDRSDPAAAAALGGDPRDVCARQGGAVDRAGRGAVGAAAVGAACADRHPAAAQPDDPAVGAADDRRAAPHDRVGRPASRGPVGDPARRRLVPRAARRAAGARRVRQAGAGDAAPEAHRGTRRRGHLRTAHAAGRAGSPRRRPPGSRYRPQRSSAALGGSGWCRRSRRRWSWSSRPSRR